MRASLYFFLSIYDFFSIMCLFDGWSAVHQERTYTRIRYRVHRFTGWIRVTARRRLMPSGKCIVKYRRKK